jgi:aldose 1-epimerase
MSASTVSPPRLPFGVTPAGEPVELVTLGDPGGIEVSILTYGAAIQQLWAPDREGRRANVALGFSSLDGYAAQPGHYFGAVVGRYANRIGGGRLELDGAVHELSRNEGESTLHGGATGFGARVWRLEETGAGSVALRYVSPAGEMGFPGTLVADVFYRVSGSSLRVDFAASTDAPTVVNLTSHGCWNLAGEGAGPVDDHVLTVAASAYTPVDGRLLPTGEVAPVGGTPLDFRRPVAIGARLRDGCEQLQLARGYDHNLVLDRAGAAGLFRAAHAYEPSTGRTLEILTTEPGLQLYTGNFLDGRLVGTGGRAYRQGDCLALETQHFPDSPNRPAFPSTTLRPGETFRSTTVFRLGVS